MARQIDADAQARIWKYYQNLDPDSFQWARPRLVFLSKQVRRILKDGTGRVLTVGAGDGFLERRLSDIGYRVTCVDLDEVSVAELMDAGIDARQTDISAFDWQEEPFDVIVASEVLEHLEGDVAPIAVENLIAALKTNGHLLATVPCREDLSRSLCCCPHCGEVSHRYGHVQSFDESALRRLITTSGLNVVQIRENLFPNYNGLNIGGKLSYAAKHLAWRVAGRHTSGLKYFVHAVK